jgi:sugar phosphate isomerase/epimerase
MEKLFTNTINKMPIGFTTNMFINSLNNREVKLEDLMIWGKKNGFSWVEIRDPYIDMTKEELCNIKDLGEKLNLNLHYAWDTTDLLNPKDEEFYRAIENAVVFGKGVHCRVVISPEQFKNDKNKIGYSEEELDKIIVKVQEYTKISKDKDVVLCFENSFEPLNGDSKSYFGIIDILEKCKEIKTTFDPGNFTNKGQTRAIPSNEELIRYAEKYNQYIPYIHVKNTINNILQSSIINNGDFDLKEIFNQLTKLNNKLICIELPCQTNYKLMQEMILDSINYLCKEGFIKKGTSY